MNKNNLIGHILALFVALIWGTTLISTKILLVDFKPVEILFFRFIISLIIFYLICPHRMPKTTKKQNLTVIFAGFFGITLYYLLENTALIFTLASNVGVINCMAPFFTAILALIFMKNKEKLGWGFFVGFVISIVGISLITFNGKKINLNPLGDILALMAPIAWAFYSVLIKKAGSFGFSTILITRKTFLYGTLFMIPFLFLFDFHFALERFLNPKNLGNILYLGVLASAVCFAAWNKTIKILGAVKCSIYIYLIPVITVITSAIVLKEQMTPLLITGTLLTLLGLIISEFKQG